ncbi:TDP-N-acetylfucosamine:lipid II N-acetylfucosaminyltransferase [uncultured Maribacter sp.]|uniref:TDP-N-acetylfucosamine:lipid II N-acetylfucosaminyltransferase n=1 Tax=uncultured Maribacter sp. TaxID=431308 RepID=UPI0030D9D315|tara:strand:+ start:8738 stop:9907 length:1170 start_codon:yes stop_codon:yes gene_type:complete
MKTKRELIHISDDEKFVDNIYWQFEKIYPGQNKYYILVDNASKALKYVTKRNGFIIVEKKNYRTISKLLNPDNIVFIHNLEEYKSRIVLETSGKVNFVWMFYGVEYFSFFDAGDLFGPISRKYQYQWLKTFLKRKFEPLFLTYHFIKNKKKHPRLLIREAVKKVSYFAIVHEEDFLLVKNKLRVELKHFLFSYYPLEFIVSDLGNGGVNSNNILLGNSSFLSNNHFEAIQILSKMNIQGRKIITPLSYGDADYAEEVMNVGKIRFGASFVPINNFMPLKEYNKILNSCSVAIFNNYRQQAIGNTITLLWMGTKVYLDERNTFYQFLKRLKIHIFSINKDLNENNPKALESLNESEIKHNRKILSQELGSKVLLNKLHDQIELIYSQDSE